MEHIRHSLQASAIWINTLLSARATLQNTVISHNNQSANAHWEEPSSNDPQINGYSNKSYPKTTTNSDIDIYSINYYDNYDFDADGNADHNYIGRSGYTNNTTTKVKGLLTASKVKVLDGTDRWIMTINFYDKYGRVKQRKNWNAIGEWDITWNEYDFTGKVKKSYTERKKSGLTDLENIPIQDSPTVQNIKEERIYTYDHAGRLKTTKLKLNNGTAHILNNNTYNELGELVIKKVGNTNTANPLQTINYTYNIRGWLTNINNPTSLGKDLFGMNLLYNEDHVFTGNAQYNGNISGYKWKSKHDNVMRNYGFSYDGLNRLKQANYSSPNDSNFDVGMNDPITYDRNGNILSLSRQGMLGTTGNYGLMDDLTYTYKDGNQLNRVDDSEQLHTYDADVPEFKEQATSDNEYIYDDNGNMISDANKEISSILYNHLNLPIKVVFSNSQPDVEWTYDAAGVKVKKVYGDNIKWYISGVEYAGGGSDPIELEAIYNEEGRVIPDGSGWQYEYTIADHLGNARISFTDSDGDGSIDTNPSNGEILQTQSYYPFGLEMSGLNSLQVGVENLYQFQGQELQVETGWSSFKWRNADPTIGRFFNVDPLAEKYAGQSPYSFSENKVTLLPELEGLETGPPWWAPYTPAAKRVDMTPTAWQSQNTTANPEAVSTSLDIIPVVGDVKGIYEGFTGKDTITRAKLSWWQRGLGFLFLSELRGGANLLYSFKGVKAAGKASDLTSFEKTVSKNLTKSGDSFLGLGDKGVRKALRLGKEGKVADFLSVTKGGRFNITEVKNSFGGAEVGSALNQIGNTLKALKNQVSDAKVGKLTIALPKGGKLGDGYSVSGNQLVKITDDGTDVVKIDGNVVHVEYYD